MIVTTDTQNTRWFVHDTQDPGHGALVLLHGFTGCSGFWEEVVDRLKPDFRCIVPDLPGHGRTEVPEGIEHFRLPRVAESLATMLKQMEVTEAAVWGYSMGGRLALQFAVAFPEYVTRLVLEGASPGIADSGERQKRREDDDRLADEIDEVGVEAFVDRWLGQPLFSTQRRLPESKQRRAREMRTANSARGLAMSLRGMGTGAQEPLHDQLSRLTVPTLVLAGEQDDKFRAIGRAMAVSISGASFRVVPGAGHTTFWEQPDTSVRIVRPFLLGQDPPDPFATRM